MVKAAPNSISECGAEVEDPNATRNCCAKFDLSLADTSIPGAGNVAELLVTNGLDYAIGQWIYFPSIDARLKITLINGNKLSVRNGCDDGTDGLHNPPVGTTIVRSSVFYVIDEPECDTANASQEFLDSLTEGAHDILLPNLEESDGSEKVQITGVVVEDDDESTFRKALKRVLGFFFKGGKPFFVTDLLTKLVESQLGSKCELYVDKATGEVQRRGTFAEIGLDSNKSLTRRIAQGKERFDDVRALAPLDPSIVVAEIGTPLGSGWIDIAAGVHTGSKNIGGSQITDLNIHQSSYFALVRGLVGVSTTSGDPVFLSLKINGKLYAVLSSDENSGGDRDTSSLCAFVKVNKADNLINWEIEVSGGASKKHYLHMFVDGIFH